MLRVMRVAGLATLVLAVMAVGFAATRPDGLLLIRTVFARQFMVVREGMQVTRDVRVAMPDGVTLATDIYLPRADGKRVPALLLRLPYGKNQFEGALWWVRAYVPRGYAVVVQDLRGRYGSEGIFAPYADAVMDGSATLDWIAAQTWSDGAVATAGCSALGEVQTIQAKSRNPHLRALIAEGAGGAIGSGGASHGYFGLFVGGIPNLAAAYGWFSDAGGKTPDRMKGSSADPADVINELPSGTLVSRHRKDPTDYEDFMSRFGDAAYWATLGYLTNKDRFAAPALHVNSWHDIALAGTFESADLMRRGAVTKAAREHQHVLIGPGLHCAFDAPFIYGKVGDVAVAKDAALNYDTIYSAWLDHWLRGKPMPGLAQYTYFVIGANRWDRSETWPPPDAAPMVWHLGEGTGGGVLTATQAAEGSLSWRYDPSHPTPSVGGPICCTGGLDLPAGPLDQSSNAIRADVLGFTTAPVEAPLIIAGNISAEIAFSTDAPDTDLVATVLDIGQDGRMLPIQDGALRMRYRNGFDTPTPPMQPGETVIVTVHFPPIAYEVAAGHRIGLQLASASFPRFERNLNTDGQNGLATMPRIATNRVYFGNEHGSVLILPVQTNTHGGAIRAN